MGRNALNNVIRNDSLTVTATITDTNGVAVNLNGYKGYLTVKATLDTANNNNDDPGLLQVVVNSISDTNGTGIVSFQCTPTQTNIIPGNYVYDVEVVSPSGNVYSSVEDQFNLIADVTRSV